jgi:hypothetical protein
MTGQRRETARCAVSLDGLRCVELEGDPARQLQGARLGGYSVDLRAIDGPGACGAGRGAR